MTMMEDWKCKNCKKNHVHMCNTLDEVKKEYGTNDCPLCGSKNVNVKHLCKAKIPTLTHICVDCGRVADKASLLCNPVPIEDAKKAEWKKVSTKEGDVKLCNTCRQPVTGRGHICDPVVPYTCKYCGKEVKDESHMCKEIMAKAKFYCNLCGRLAVEKDEICTGWELK